MAAHTTHENPRDALGEALDRGSQSLDLPDDASLVLAVSGGPDSMALLHAAAHLVAGGRRRWSLTAAHLDHGLRPESGGDAEFVRDQVAKLDLPFVSRRTDVAALARDEARSMEDAGREARYRFLEEVAADVSLIAVAHTADDAAETVIINLLRGSGLAGVGGIAARRGRIIRPFIAERRAGIRALLDAAGIEYRLDPSNDDPSFLRNRVRGEVLPLLDDLREGSVERIGRFARLAAADDALLDVLAGAELERRRTGDGSIDWLRPPGDAIARRVLRLAVGEPAPSSERIEALMDAAAGGRGGVRIELGGGRIASVRRRRITVE